MMSEAELDALARDLAKNGLQVPIVWIKTKEGMQLLDGRDRIVAVARIPDQKRRGDLEKALQKNLVILPGFIDARQHVASLNLHRRHLTAEQKRELITELLKANPERSDSATAKIARSSDKTVTTIRRVLEANSEIPNKSIERKEESGRKARGRKPKSTTATPRDVTVGNAESPASEVDPIAEIAAIVKRVEPALATMTPQDRERLRSILDGVIAELRYAGMPAAEAARKKSQAERTQRSREKARTTRSEALAATA